MMQSGEAEGPHTERLMVLSGGKTERSIQSDNSPIQPAQPKKLDSQIQGSPAANAGREAESGSSVASVPDTAIFEGKKVDRLPSTTTWNTQEPKIIEQVINKVESLKPSQGSEIKVRLNPANLGEVHLRVVSTPDGLLAEIRATNSGTQDVLQRHAVQIHNLLQESGLRVDQVIIRPFGNETSQDNRGHQYQREPGSSFSQQGRDQDTQQDRGTRNPWEQHGRGSHKDNNRKWDRYA